MGLPMMLTPSSSSCFCLLFAVRWVSLIALSRTSPDSVVYAGGRPLLALLLPRLSPMTDPHLTNWLSQWRPTTTREETKSGVTGEVDHLVESLQLRLPRLRRLKPRKLP